MKKMYDYLPTKSVDFQFVQARVPRDLVRKAKGIMNEKNHSWSDVITAGLRMYVEESSLI